MVIEVQDLVAGYERNVLIRNLFFSVTEPAFIAIIGHNGSGKTTFFKAFTGSIPYSGRIAINQTDLTTIANPAAEGLYSYLPQRNVISFPVSVTDLVVMGVFRKKRFFENYYTSDYDLARLTLERLQIGHLADRNFTELSGGEQQLVWLAQLMLQDAAVCLLDEPTQQLDVYHKKRVFKLLSDWVEKDQKTVLCITHDLTNLYPLQGYLLNFAKPDPKLEVISKTTVDENLAFLEEKHLF